MSDSGVAVVIEDDADMRNILAAVLLQSGFEVHSASGGREGFDVVRDKRADVVTLDVGLPDIDGFEVLRRIRQFSNAYVVVMVTGRTEESDLLTALHSGADDYITKPFRPREMRKDRGHDAQAPITGLRGPYSARAPHSLGDHGSEGRFGLPAQWVDAQR